MIFNQILRLSRNDEGLNFPRNNKFISCRSPDMSESIDATIFI
jgi:hypothetical protein